MKSRVPTFIFCFGIPFLLICVGFPFYNRAEPMILGFPFVYFWMFICLAISSLCLGIGWWIDPKTDRNRRKLRAIDEAQGTATTTSGEVQY